MPSVPWNASLPQDIFLMNCYWQPTHPCCLILNYDFLSCGYVSDSFTHSSKFCLSATHYMMTSNHLKPYIIWSPGTWVAYGDSSADGQSTRCRSTLLNFKYKGMVEIFSKYVFFLFFAFVVYLLTGPSVVSMKWHIAWIFYR